MFKRLLTTHIEESLAAMPAIALLGPRQVGKTTLALQVAEAYPSVYLDLESSDDKAKLQDPLSYFSHQAGKLVVLDEIQRIPELFQVLRGVIDKGRRNPGGGNGQFLILGSASRGLLKQTSESLAGRITYLELMGLNPLEITPVAPEYLTQLWVRGGFPPSYLSPSEARSVIWREDFIRTYLERDIPQLGPSIPAETLRRFWTMLAHLQGTPVNAARIAASLEVSSTTVHRYLDLLVDLLLVRKLQPWHANVGKRLVKMPRIYVRDSGLLHQLLKLSNVESLLAHPIVGKSWEGFVIEQLLSVVPKSAEAYFYRTAAGTEIDLLLQLPDQQLWAIEIKRSSAAKVEQGFYQACEDVKPTKKFVVYNGQEQFPLPHGVVAIGLPGLMQEIFSKYNP